MPVMSAVERGFCLSLPWSVLARRAVLPWALWGQRPAGEVLEIGAGSGAMADGLAVMFPEARLTVTDVDEAMVTAARRRLARRSNATAEQADVTALPFPDARFDLVTSYLMLHHVVDWPAALRESARVLRPGGVLAGYDLTRSGVARLVHRLDGSPTLLLTPEELRGGLLDAGFEQVVVGTTAAGHLMRFRAERSRSDRAASGPG